MTLLAGARLGAYEVIAPIGAGGMGEVYRARDTKLGRDVAIKVVPESFSQDKERNDRFEREAKLLASLNHPGIATLHGLEHDGQRQLLVMELVEGETLADRIARGALPVDEALPLFKDIAEALEAAHDKGIIHRDLKPANIKITPDDKVKLLDFGLAKAFDPEQPPSDSSQSPTLTQGTALGAIMGTAAYMSPEQARGKPVDKRTDIWAFGCCLYEALTGKKAFEGEVVTETLAAVLKNDPDWGVLPADLPGAIHQALQLCLTKDRKRRMRDIGDLSLVMEGAFETGAGRQKEVVISRPTGWRLESTIAAALIPSVITGVTVWSVMRSTGGARPVTRSHIGLPADHVLSNIDSHAVALSPKGTHLVYSANESLYLRAMDATEATPLRGAERADNPFFSPNGEWIGFQQSGELKKVSIRGGAPTNLCKSQGIGRGAASWSVEDTIVFAQDGRGIMEVSAEGGTPEVLVRVDRPEIAHRPQVLAGHEAVLFTLGEHPNWDDARIVVHSLETGDRKVLIEGGKDARYLSTGHLVYVFEETLLAVPFDERRLAVTGEPVTLVESVMSGFNHGAAQFSVSDNGTLVYARGGSSKRRLVWVDRQGREEELSVEPRAFTYPRVSPDGTRVALEVRDRDNDIWIWDLERETLTRLTSDPAIDAYPTWTPDGRRIAFSSSRDGPFYLFTKSADGAGVANRLSDKTSRQGTTAAYAYTPDGKQLLVRIKEQSQGLWLVSVDGTSEPLVATEFSEMNAELSPDGKWLAYESNGSGQFEIYVRPFPNVNDGQRLISSGGGTRPLWGADGRELFFLAPSGQLMAVAVRTEPGFAAGKPEVVFEKRYFMPQLSSMPGRTYDISSDGERFLMIKEDEDLLKELVLVQNWFEELKELVPTN